MIDLESRGTGSALRAVAAVVLCVQLMPAGMPVVAELAHGLYHFSGALSLDYLLPTPPTHTHTHATSPTHLYGEAHVYASGPIAHELERVPGHRHEGTEALLHGSEIAHMHAEPSAHHEHNRAVDSLLKAAGVEGRSDIGSPTSPHRGLDLHLPSLPVHLALSIDGSASATGEEATSPVVAIPCSEPPPPRA